jgi:hypothetical protein
MKNSEEILRPFLISNQGYLQTKDFRRNSKLFAALQDLVKSNLVVKVKAGLYKNELYAEKNELQELSQIYPKGILCLYSAWNYYELSTDIPAFHSLAFPNKYKVKTQEYPPIQAYFWSDKYYSLEIEEKDGIKIYSLEKSICDAVKFRNKIGLHFMSTILKNYLKRKDRNLDKLFRIGKIMKIENILREYLILIL